MRVTGPLAELTRRDVRRDVPIGESTHAGTLVVSDADGEVLASLGDPDAARPLFGASLGAVLGLLVLLLSRGSRRDVVARTSEGAA